MGFLGGAFQAGAFQVRFNSSLTANAVLTAGAGTFPADAILLKDIASSVTADAVLLKSLSFSLTADAVLTIPGILTFSANSVLKKSVSSSLTADAVLSKLHHVTADAVLHGSVTRTFTAGAFVSSGTNVLEIYYTSGSGWTDVSANLFWNGQTPALVRDWKVNEPQELTFILEDYDTFQVPDAGNRVRLTLVDYGVFFNGYIDTTPTRDVVGSNDGVTPVYGYQCHAISEEVALNWASALKFGTWPPFVGKTQGAIVKALISGLGGTLDTTSVADGITIPFFRLQRTENFSAAVRRLLDKTNVRFWTRDGYAFLQPYNDASFGYSPDESDSKFNPFDLEVSPVQGSVFNDVVGFGDLEAQAYVREYFLGDGITATFPLRLPLFGAVSSKLLEDDFTSGAIDVNTWLLTDPGNVFSASVFGYLAVKGSTPGRMTAKQGVEIAGALEISAGRVQFDASNQASLPLKIEDANGVLWTLSVSGGELRALEGSAGTAVALYMNDPGGTISRQFGIDASGNVELIPVTFNSGYPTSVPVDDNWLLGIDSSGDYTLTPSQGSDAIIGALFSNDTGSFVDCVAGFNASPVYGGTQLQAIVSGALAGPTYITQPSKTYQLILHVDCSEAVRYRRAFYSLNNSYGGANVTAEARVSFTVYELPDYESDKPIAVLSYSSTVANIGEFLYFTEAAVQGSSDFSLNFCTLKKAVAAEIWTKPAPYDQAVLADQQFQNYAYYWRLGSATAKDLSSGALPTFSGTYSFGAGAISGDTDKALTLTGTGYAEAPADAYFSGGPFTVEGWVYPTSYASEMRVIDFGNGTANDNIILCASQGTTGKPYFALDAGPDPAFSIQASAPLTLNGWSHLVGTFDGTTARLYVNGVLVAEADAALNSQGTFLAPSPITRNNCYIGKSNWSADSLFQGSIDELAIYQSALTADQVTEHYRAAAAHWFRDRIGDKTDLTARCTISVGSDNRHEIQFFAGAAPAQGEKLKIVYRSAGVIRARVQNTTSITAEAAKAGDTGERSGYLPAMQVSPRNAAEMETAIQAYIDDHTAILYQGSWTFNTELYGLSTDPMPGRILDVNATTRHPNFTALVTEVKSSIRCLDDNLLEVVDHEVSFGPLTIWDSIQLDWQPPAEELQGQLDTLVDLTAISFASVGTSFAGDRADADFDGTINADSYEIDAGAAPDSIYELRKSDQAWGGSTVNEISTATTETFTVPRNSLDVTVFIKNKTAAGLFSRYPSVVRFVWPIVPNQLKSTTLDVTDPQNPVVKIDPEILNDASAWGYEIRANDNSTVLKKFGSLVLVQSDLAWTYQNNASRSVNFWIYAYNLLGEYSTGYQLGTNVATPELISLSVDESSGQLVWTTADAANGAETTSYKVEIATDSGFADTILTKTVTDQVLPLDTENVVKQRWFRVTPNDVFGAGTPLTLSHVHVTAGLVEWDNTDNTYSVPNPPTTSSDIAPPTAFTDYTEELQQLSQAQWRLQPRL